MGIQIGCALVAENGYQVLRKGQVYFFLKSNRISEVAWLVQFIGYEGASTIDGLQAPLRSAPIPVLISMQRGAFEKGVSEELITKKSGTSDLPPWLESLVGRDLVARDKQRKKKRRSHLDVIEGRYQKILPLLERESEILNSDDPDKEINAHARRCVPRQNETRLRRWFYTYLLFGRNKLALHYSFGNIGKWDRTLPSRKKQGAPSKYFGKFYGHHTCAATREKIVAAYILRAKLGIPIVEMYQQAMTGEFGCKVHIDSHGLRSYVQPKGLPYPSPDVFRYHINMATDRKIVRRTKIGANRERTENQPSAGRFTERTANLMETVETDGHFIKELPRGYIDELPLPPLCQVRMRDTASGLLIGIGFSLGSETAAAYLAAMFCAAIDKVKFCWLFGIHIRPEEWPSVGLSPFQITDRGVGATDKAQPREGEYIPIYRGMAPSYSGQSKSVVESSHPKQVSNKEAPSYVDSTLTPHELVRRSIFQLLADNDKTDVQERIPLDLIPHIHKTSPIGLWNTLDKLGRNDAQTMAFDNAVRQFLPLHDATADTDGIHFNGQLYHSPTLRKSELLHRLAERGQSIKVKVYVLEACVRHIWLDVDGTLEELGFIPPLRVSDECALMTLNELKQLHAIQLENQARFAQHRNATISDFAGQYTEQTGKKWDASVRKPGRAKRGTKGARKEASEAKRALSGKLSE